jgi:hypothetical protein
MALGLTQPLTEMSTRNNSWWQRRPVRRADNLTALKSVILKLLEPSGPDQVCNGIALPLPFTILFNRDIPLRSYILLSSFCFCFGIQTIQFIYTERVFFNLILHNVGRLNWYNSAGKVNLITKFAQFFFPRMLLRAESH